MRLNLSVTAESFELKQVFRIARGAKTQADVLRLTLSDGEHMGQAEAVPYQRYGESLQNVSEQVLRIAQDLIDDISFEQVQQLLPAGAARNLLDCALWDLRARQQKTSVSQLLNQVWLPECHTAQTLSIDTPQAMQDAAVALGQPQLIKVKLDRHQVVEKMRAIHTAAPHSGFIVDANEGWSFELLQAVAPELAALNVVLIEQPLPASSDSELEGYISPVPLCADESCHTSEQLPDLLNRYQAINIKLDKTGGLSEAIKLKQHAQDAGMQVMLGCMVGSSLAMAPAYALAANVQFVDLDGPALIASDREQGFHIHQGVMRPATPFLWGQYSL